MLIYMLPLVVVFIERYFKICFQIIFGYCFCIFQLQQEVESLNTRRSIDDRDLRSRFFVCMQLEEMLQSILPEAYVLPFGSCLNGFGWWDSDLDMMLCFSKELCSTQLTVSFVKIYPLA